MPTPRNTTKSRRRPTTWSRGQTKTQTTHRYSKNSPAFKRIRDECQWRMYSYRNVYSQFTGAGTQTTFSPTNANKWLKFVHTGCRVYKFASKDFYKYFGTQWQTQTPTACFRWMKKQYGPGIKAVSKGNGTSWLVAATQTVTGRPFRTYNWK